ncbi:MAG: hypothetical protein O2779_00565 [Nanoarchaeota archaeon]|nr:hypothetical protein [Nanoarchaeota archaeon]
MVFCSNNGHPEKHDSRLILSIFIIIFALIEGGIGKAGVIIAALVVLSMSIQEREEHCCKVSAPKKSKKKK